MPRLFGATRVTSRPSTTIAPASGRSKPATNLSAVVLPQPDGPRSERNSPSPSPMWIPFSALTPPKLRWRSFSSRKATSARSCHDGRARPALATNEQQGQHRRPRYPEADERGGARGICLRLVHVLQVDREGVELGEVRDRELAEHDGQRQEGPGQRGRSDVRQDDLEERAPPARAEALRRLRQRVDVDGAEPRVEREEHVRER